MTIAYTCVLIILLFPYIFATIAKAGSSYNNHDPRNFLEKTTGWRKRANYVQLNSFEASPAFAIAVIIAHLAHAYQPTIDKIAIIFVLARIIYAICYLTDKAALRSLFWGVGFACIIGLFYVAY
jgi:uncharacterized MAPEG superfamily protein